MEVVLRVILLLRLVQQVLQFLLQVLAATSAFCGDLLSAAFFVGDGSLTNVPSAEGGTICLVLQEQELILLLME
jgi:hypothetical protein